MFARQYSESCIKMNNLRLEYGYYISSILAGKTDTGNELTTLVRQICERRLQIPTFQAKLNQLESSL